ncbi:MAG: hypothetical protein IJW21_03775 [Clostridia bacterium]|nr:hypothetical protein [Clostridia bacterium]
MIVTRNLGAAGLKTSMSSPVYIDVRNEPFRVYGLCDFYKRIPEAVSEACLEGVQRLAKNTTGARVRFRTTSDFIVVHAELESFDLPSSKALIASRDFDIYLVGKDGKQHFRTIFSSSVPEDWGITESRIKFENKELKDVVLNLPLTANIKSLYIGLREGSELLPGSEYKHKKPVVFYGSSIVHGEGAMRPGNTYPAIISRRLDTDCVNLGFRGSATAETAMMEYIASLPMSVFVYDYDYNAPNIAHLQNTHYAGYEIFRAKQPKTPVIFASRVNYYEHEADIRVHEKRRSIIKESYYRALAEGDRNVYFIDGAKIYPMDKRDECTVDGCHPNDMGYSYMADAFGAVINDLIGK